MDEKEILGLSELSPLDQIEWLKTNEILTWRRAGSFRFDERPDLDSVTVWESLADCAFRLRKPVMEKIGQFEWEVLLNATMKETNRRYQRHDEPIDWIQTALRYGLEK